MPPSQPHALKSPIARNAAIARIVVTQHIAQHAVGMFAEHRRMRQRLRRRRGHIDRTCAPA